MAALLFVLPVLPVLAAEPRFSWLGVTPAQAGHNVAQTAKALGAPLVLLPGGAHTSCQHRSATTHPGATFIFDKGVLVRTDTRSRSYATQRGARIGDSEAAVRKLYGKQLVVTPHPYFDRGHLLAVYSPDKRFALVMESNDAGVIVTMRGGRKAAVERLEGCD